MTAKTKPKAAVPAVVKKPLVVRRSHRELMVDVCGRLSAGRSLVDACKDVADAPTPTAIMQWVDSEPDLALLYAHAREVGYRLLADEIVTISDETEVEVRYNGNDVTLVLDATAVARNRLRVDTRKWMLSKMLPKTFGDKTTTELTGANGGAIQVAAVPLSGLSDGELEQMRLLMSKAVEGGV